MTSNERTSPGQHNIVFGGGVINTGSNNQINNAVGSGNRASNIRLGTDTQVWLAQLRAELTRIRVRLEEDEYHSALAVDRDDALDSVRDLEAVLDESQEGSEAYRRSLRLRVKRLIGILAPVAEIIGGVAALEAVAQHL